MTLYNGSGGTVQLVADVAGYYLGGGDPALPGTFVPVPTVRLLSTVARGGVAARSVTDLALPGPASAVPVDAAVLNVTSVTPAAAGYLSVFPTGTQVPNTSSVNFNAG